MCICVCLRAGVSDEAQTARREGWDEGRAVGSEEADPCLRLGRAVCPSRRQAGPRAVDRARGQGSVPEEF